MGGEGEKMEFSDLRVWGEAKALVVKTYAVTAKFPARGSISESQSHLMIALELGYVDKAFADEMIAGFDKVRKMLNALIKSVNRCNDLRAP